MSCLLLTESALKFRITVFASEPGRRVEADRLHQVGRPAVVRN